MVKTISLRYEEKEHKVLKALKAAFMVKMGEKRMKWEKYFLLVAK